MSEEKRVIESSKFQGWGEPPKLGQNFTGMVMIFLSPDGIYLLNEVGVQPRFGKWISQQKQVVLFGEPTNLPTNAN